MSSMATSTGKVNGSAMWVLLRKCRPGLINLMDEKGHVSSEGIPLLNWTRLPWDPKKCWGPKIVSFRTLNRLPVWHRQPRALRVRQTI